MTGKSSSWNNFLRPCLVLCEGASDKKVLHRLITINPELHGKFHVTFPRTSSDPSGGNGKFALWLNNTANVSESFRTNVKAVLIIADADSSGEESFRSIQTGLAQYGLPVPAQIGEAASPTGNLSCNLAVYLIPEEANGCLDSLCANALVSKWGLSDAVNDFLKNTPAENWSPAKYGKARLHVTMAVTCATKPETNLIYVWQEAEDYHIPLDTGEFDALVKFMISFCAAYPSVSSG